MTDLRKAAEMALEALEMTADKFQVQRNAITSLRQALAQPEWVGLTEEEVDECYYWKDRLWTTDELVRHVEAKLKEKNNG